MLFFLQAHKKKRKREKGDASIFKDESDCINNPFLYFYDGGGSAVIEAGLHSHRVRKLVKRQLSALTGVRKLI